MFDLEQAIQQWRKSLNKNEALEDGYREELGLRKVVGAHRSQIVWQFIGESFLITFIAFICAIGLISLLLSPFNQMAGTKLSLAGITQPVVLASLLGLLLFVAVGSGFYPAFILTAHKPISVLHGKLSPTPRGSLLQKILVVGQFAISILLVICTLTVFQQLNFMRGRALGFDLQQKLVLRIKSNLRHLRSDYEAIKQDFLENPSITGASTPDIVAMLSKKFVLLILISILIASPIAWLSMNKWLQDFAYRVDLSLFVFFVAAGGALVIALGTVGFRGIRSALDNPATSLRDE